ncbi:MAG: tail fiber protein [Candidatus Electrothrix sp. AR5]|nr:tail fiber protein [Candidatus Electrothrix sp. AR5]
MLPNPRIKRTTKQRLLTTILLTLFFAATTTYANEVPNFVHYEGYLTKNGAQKTSNSKTEKTSGGGGGQAIQDGEYDITFRLYDVSAQGEALWTEIWDSSTMQVLVSKGHFRVFLGTHTPLLPTFFKEHPETYLAITIGDEDEMLPRQRIASVPYAMSTYSDEPPFPAGGIIMWSGEIGSIPEGWALCDGTNGTPDLRDRFVTGAGGNYNPSQQGGNSNHNHTIGISAETTNTGAAGAHAHHMDFPIHKESCRGDCVDGAKDGDKDVGSDSHGHNIVGDTESGGNHTHPVSAHNHSGNISSSDSLPPFFALAFIMKL